MRTHRWILSGGTGAVVFAWYMVSLVREGMFAAPWPSIRACIGVLFVVLIIVWPLVGALGAADAVLSTTSGRLAFIESLPLASRSRLVAGRLAAVWFGVLAATVAACAVAVAVGLVHGSGWSWGALGLVPYALAGCLAFSAVGYALGLAVRSWFVPPLVLLGGYAMGNIPATAFLEWYAGVYPPGSIVSHPNWSIYVPLTAGFALAAAAGVVGLAARWSRTSAVVAVVLFCASLATHVAVPRTLTPDQTLWVDDDHRTLSCTTLAEGPSVCVPPDLPRDASLAVAQLAPMAPRVVALDAALADAHWIPGRPGPGELAYQLPVGQDVSTWQQALATATGLSAECATKFFLSTGDTPPALPADMTAVAAWLAGDRADATQVAGSGILLPVTQDDARDAYSRITACAY
ncbi:MAG: hypothetical protein FWC46_00740 [Actinomycetia bacterium]|nr:hypothetical protein [Actinomycetes bacterium]